VVGSGDTGHGDAQASRCYLGAVKEVCAEEANGDEEVEEENEESRRNLRSAIACREARCDGKCKHARRHASTTEHEQLPAPETIDGEEGDETREEFPSQRTPA